MYIPRDCPAQPGDRRITAFLCDRSNRQKIALGCKRKAGLDHIDAELFELTGHRDLFVEKHRAARALFAVA